MPPSPVEGDVVHREPAAKPGEGGLLNWRRRSPRFDTAVRLAVCGVIIVLVWRLADVFLLMFLAVLIATVLRGIADRLATWLGLSPMLMLAVVAILLTAGCLAAAYWIGPALAGEADQFFARLTTQLESFSNHFGQTELGQALGGQISRPKGLETDVGGYFYSVASSTVSIAGSLFAVLVMSLYLAASAETYVDGAVRLVPIAHRALARHVLEESGHNLRRWMLGQSVDMLTVGGLSAIGLYLLGVPVPFALALLAGLLTIVPYFGALAAAIPGVLVAMTQSWTDAIWVLVIFLICHSIEGYIVAPLVQRHMVEMPPAVIIATMAISATLFGPFGIVLGTPLAVVGLVLVRRVYVEHILGDRDTAPGT